ncbi:MAG TPA: anaerobic sulfatase maturase [Thermoanaerobaculia bacterium]|nr:anaerobic sulfatase maturase [Thermoanaerobaculia bacterium]
MASPNGPPADAAPRLFRGKPVVRMHAMVKPGGPICNLDCQYCYYLSKEGLLGAENGWRISDETLETFIRQYIEGQNCKEVVFSWQGGEPTLLGLDFFRRAIALEKKYCPPHTRCENDLQTNGTRLDDAWCDFLRENGFLVGLSIDGPRDLHDAYRRDKAGRGTFDRVLRAAKLLRKHGVRFATLSCVNRATAMRPVEVYRFLRDEVGSRRIQFIPVVEPKSFRGTAPQHWAAGEMPIAGTSAAQPGTPDSVVEEWSVDPRAWGEFLCRVFDEWYSRDLARVHVQYFEAAVETWMGRVSPLCTLGPLCGKGLAVEHDGGVYACDHYVYPEFRLGNVLSEPIAGMALSAAQERFGRNKEATLPGHCRQCEYEFACYGECPKNRFVRTPSGEPGLNYLCAGWKAFWRHVDAPISRIVRDLGYAPVKKTVYATSSAME